MNKYLIACLLFVSACSFDTRSGIWTDKKEIIASNKDTTVLFEIKEDRLNNIDFTKGFDDVSNV